MHPQESQQALTLQSKLLSISDLDRAPEALWQSLCVEAERITEQAFSGNRTALFDFHATLHLLLCTHQAMPHTWGAIQHGSTRAFALRKAFFSAYMEAELDRLTELALPAVPGNPGRLVEYLLEISAEHPASCHPIFDYLRSDATLREVKSFFYQESSVDTRFDDLIALAQIGTDGTVKDEYAHNFSDEMGHGDPNRVHSLLFSRTAEYISRFQGQDKGDLMIPYTETLACSNMQLGMALSRRHVWRLAGYLAAFELYATDRCRRLVDACVRQGMDVSQLEYLTEHIDADVGHARGLFQEVIEPMAASDTRAPLEITQGFLLRLQTSQAYCDEMLRKFLTL